MLSNFLNLINFFDYWNLKEIQVNIIIIFNLLGAMILGMLLGYERIYQGRAAGMRTYSLVSMASCALTVFNGYAHHWYGGQYGLQPIIIDPTRTIQGIVTGVGFLGAGVIMKEGLTISGLSTAASIWLCSAIGILVGIGFYSSAIALTFIAILGMLLISKFETHLPHKKLLSITIKFKPNFILDEEAFLQANINRGYTIAPNSLSIVTTNKQQEITYLAYSINKNSKATTISKLSNQLNTLNEIDSFSLTPVRN